MKDFRDLLVWQKAHEFVLSIYQATSKFPREELYGIVSQLRRAAVSIPTNMAEGCGRGTDADFQRFLQIAMGSSSEVEYLLFLAHDLGLTDDPTYAQLDADVREIKRMLASFIRKLKADR